MDKLKGRQFTDRIKELEKENKALRDDIMTFKELLDKALSLQNTIFSAYPVLTPLLKDKPEMVACDNCGSHPTVFYTTDKGRLCKKCNELPKV